MSTTERLTNERLAGLLELGMRPESEIPHSSSTIDRDPLAEVAAPVHKAGKKARKQPTDKLPLQGSRQSHKGRRDVRRAIGKTDVIKGAVDLAPITEGQVKWLQREWQAAWKYQVSKCGDDRSYNDFRHEECQAATLNHEAGRCEGLSAKSGARRGHFEVLMATAKQLQGQGGQAMEWHLKDDPEARRRARTLNLIRELLMRLMPPPDYTGDVGAFRLAWGNTYAQNLYKKDVPDLDADQADYCFRKMKQYLNVAELNCRAERWLAAQNLTPAEYEAKQLAPVTDEGRPF